MTTEAIPATEKPDLDAPLARRAVLTDAKVRLFAWGEPGTGKSRLGLSFPKPLVVDLENSTGLYAGEFDFLVARYDEEAARTMKPHQLVFAVAAQIRRGMYAGEVETLVIDPVTDFMDSMEAALMERMAGKGVNIATLSGMAKAKAYNELNEAMTSELKKLLGLPLHVVFVSRAKNLWGTNAQGKMDVIGRQPDCKEIVAYLADVNLKMERDGTAIVEKSRLGALPERIKAVGYKDIEGALAAAQAKTPEPTAAPSKATKAKPATCATCNGTQGISVDDGGGGKITEPCPECVPLP